MLSHQRLPGVGTPSFQVFENMIPLGFVKQNDNGLWVGYACWTNEVNFDHFPTAPGLSFEKALLMVKTLHDEIRLLEKL